MWSRGTWLKCKDSNTKYFYNHANRCPKRNLILDERPATFVGLKIEKKNVVIFI